MQTEPVGVEAYALTLGQCGADYAFRQMAESFALFGNHGLSEQGCNKMLSNLIGFASR